MTIMAMSVDTAGRSFRNIHDRRAPNIGLKVTTKTTLAIAVLKTANAKVSVESP
jgi:hypothetical protein